VKREHPQYSCGVKLPSLSEFVSRQKANVSPTDYHIKEDLVKSTRYSKILAGGSSPKDGMVFNTNPGPGDYQEGNSIQDIINTRKKHKSSSFASTLGKSFYSSEITPGGSPRACAFGLPSTLESFNEHGFIKNLS
jgi:hypothetical protein